MEPTHVRTSTDSDAEEEAGFWDSNDDGDDDGDDEGGREEEEEEEGVLSFQGQLLEAASPSKRKRAPAASAGAVKPDIVDGEAVLPNLLLAYMYRPLDFMEYSLYEFFCMVILVLKPKKGDREQTAAKGQAGPGRPSNATYELNGVCELSKTHELRVCLPLIHSPPQCSPFRGTYLKATL